MPSSTACSGRCGVVSTLRVLRILAHVQHDVGERATDINGKPHLGSLKHSKFSVLIDKLRENRSNFHTSDNANGEAPSPLRGTYAIEGCEPARSEQECKRRLAALLDLERQEIVGAGASEIDRGDRNCRFAAACTKRKPE